MPIHDTKIEYLRMHLEEEEKYDIYDCHIPFGKLKGAIEDVIGSDRYTVKKYLGLLERKKLASPINVVKWRLHWYGIPGSDDANKRKDEAKQILEAK